jgi:hypothetical protein
MIDDETAAPVLYPRPYAAGPPSGALHVVAPSLKRLGWREVVRGIEIVAVLGVYLLRALLPHLVRHPGALVRVRRDRSAQEQLAVAVSAGAVEPPRS